MTGSGPGTGRARGSGPGGVSLVELVVALVILEIGLLGVAGIMVTAARQVARATELGRATALAQPVADSLLAYGWGGPGQRSVAPYEVSWARTVDVLSVEVTRPADGRVLLRLVIPAAP